MFDGDGTVDGTTARPEHGRGTRARREADRRVRGITSRPDRTRGSEHSAPDQTLGHGRTEAEGAVHEAGMPSGWDEGVAARVERECAEQGIPVGIDDPVTVAKIITLVRAGRASRSATKAAKSARRGRPSASAKGR